MILPDPTPLYVGSKSIMPQLDQWREKQVCDACGVNWNPDTYGVDGTFSASAIKIEVKTTSEKSGTYVASTDLTLERIDIYRQCYFLFGLFARKTGNELKALYVASPMVVEPQLLKWERQIREKMWTLDELAAFARIGMRHEGWPDDFTDHFLRHANKSLSRGFNLHSPGWAKGTVDKTAHKLILDSQVPLPVQVAEYITQNPTKNGRRKAVAFQSLQRPS